MKTRLLITGIIGMIVILVIFIIGSNFAESKELMCLRLYQDINEISRTSEFALAEGETIQKHRNWIFEYVEKDCPNFLDLEFIYNNYKQNIPEPEPHPEPVESEPPSGPITLNEQYFQDLFDNYDLIIDGTVTFHTGDRYAEYKIQVHEYFKNDLGLDEINAISDRRYAGFMTGNHALFYLNQVNSTWWEISKDSISLVNKDCTDARVVLNIPYDLDNACWSKNTI